jgi:hypothetical protein
MSNATVSWQFSEFKRGRESFEDACLMPQFPSNFLNEEGEKIS